MFLFFVIFDFSSQKPMASSVRMLTANVHHAPSYSYSGVIKRETTKQPIPMDIERKEKKLFTNLGLGLCAQSQTSFSRICLGGCRCRCQSEGMHGMGMQCAYESSSLTLWETGSCRHCVYSPITERTAGFEAPKPAFGAACGFPYPNGRRLEN